MKYRLVAAAVLSASSLLVSQLSMAEESATFVERTLAIQQATEAGEAVAKVHQDTKVRHAQIMPASASKDC